MIQVIFFLILLTIVAALIYFNRRQTPSTPKVDETPIKANNKCSGENGEWVRITNCSAECNGGTATERKLLPVGCPDPGTIREVICNAEACTVKADCILGPWKNGDCIGDCDSGGVGLRINTREVVTDGDNCNGPFASEPEACILDSCNPDVPDIPDVPNIPYIPDVPDVPDIPDTPPICVLGPWIHGECIGDCDPDGIGLRINTRDGPNCNGPFTSEPEYCMLQTCPTECIESEWSQCSQECGGGVQSKTFNGGGCEIDGLETTRGCNEDACPTANECVGEWSGWSQCSQECGGGIQSQTFNGSNCDFNGVQREQECNLQDCISLPPKVLAYEKVANHKSHKGNFIKANGEITSDGALAPIYGSTLEEVQQLCNQYDSCVAVHYHKGIKAWFMKASGDIESSSGHDLYLKYSN
jgi:hypothetical protein